MTAPDLPQVSTAGAAPGRPAGIRVGRLGPRLMLRGAFVGLALLVLVVLLVGCGNAALPEAPPAPAPTASSTMPTGSSTSAGPPGSSAPPAPSAPTAPPAPAGSPAPPPAAPAPAAGPRPAPDPQAKAAPRAEQDVPSWPAGDAATAQRMQQQADRGGDPWLLDPQEVTISYVGAELEYRNPAITELAPGNYDVTDGRSPARATVTLEQTVRPGPGGIWLVTAVTRH
ncbi:MULTISPECIES: hypothetical protein [Pseudonocardia]|uniref:Uncharacterized protein n=2 Tax=Pseudonocardia TaxID=1847 RepID=A0A1Y2MRL9_PSEAH|nr:MULTISPECIES: hypothetical protein [Pseudonocardia]OSY37874.1 hypothetical protein BG845_04497 [Pseudonocardia autotrophica]TDN72463.1 hypothetical protein C8E95_1520 [Pseudonocardia autotrophica]BBG03172.1 hypothetical protein Pdca_43810 [Pseudonocardia autotrophica]GEC23788.1 hypothetical protein PSA01_08170 [Pseudonocardia saturnea]